MRNITSHKTLLLVLTLLTAASCGDDRPDALDHAAQEFVKLALQLGEYDKDYVDAYLGPADWAASAKQDLLPRDKLADAISDLYEGLEDMFVAEGESAIRHRALLRNVRAMDARMRMANGESFSFAEEARRVYDASLPAYDFAEFDAALEEIDALFPGDGDVADRVDAFMESLAIPEEDVDAVLGLAIDECRRRTLEHIMLPESEGFVLEYVNGVNWSGYNWYQGDNTSLMQINTDFSLKIDRAVDLGCHEGYPGHHVWNVLVENRVLNDRGWIEFSIYPLFSPYALIGEGSANYGIDLAFPGDQKIAYERDVLFPRAGLDPEMATTLNQLNELRRKLAHSQVATAQRYLDGQITREEAIEQRRRYGLSSRERAEQSVRFIEQYRSYVLNYSLGQDIVRDYIESQGDDLESRWDAFERMLTELVTASDMTQ